MYKVFKLFVRIFWGKASICYQNSTFSDILLFRLFEVKLAQNYLLYIYKVSKQNGLLKTGEFVVKMGKKGLKMGILPRLPPFCYFCLFHFLFFPNKALKSLIDV